ncbi:MAG: CBS domain-containing protein [Burkholderiaceae bacterium]
MSERTVYQSIPNERVLSTSPQASVYEAACLMTQANCGSILIVSQTGEMMGILTERDLMTKVVAKALAPEATPVSDVMTKNPRFVAPETSVSDAVLIMQEGGFRHLPILSPTYKVMGMFSIRDAAPREISEAKNKAEYLNLLSESVAY